MLDLAGKSALVTGSTQGIGRAIADGLREQGADVVYHGLEVDSTLGGTCLAMDLSQTSAVRRLVEGAFAHSPQMDVLVCNAGGFFDVPFLDMTEENFDKTYNLNVRAPYFLVQSFAQRLVSERRAGSIILVSSTNGLQAELDSSAYDSSKGAIMSLTRSLAVSLAPFQIRVNALAPGLIRTPLTERWLDSQQQMRLHYEKNIPLGRIGLPRDCVGTVLYLASEASAYMTGQTLVVDGGLTSSQIGPL